MKKIKECSCGNHNPFHCIVPPYMLEAMATSSNEVVRMRAIKNMETAAEIRTERRLIWPETVASILTNKEGKYREVYDMQNKPNRRDLMPGKLERWEGEEPVNDPAVNEAYDYSGHTYDFFYEIFNRDSLDDNGLTLISSVHLDVNYNNAFWNGSQMAYGDGDGIIFHRFTKGLDVIGHELTHGIISYTSRLVYRDEAGAINEHLADVFGSLVKQWILKQDAKCADWLIGNDIIIPAPTRRGIRDMKNPGTAYINDPDLNGTDPQPDHISNKYTGMQDNGGVHINSGIPNKAFCETAIAIGGYSWEKAGRIWYEAMLQLTPESNFERLVKLTKDISVKLYGPGSDEFKAVVHGWETVGLNDVNYDYYSL
ncbi:M4 family metallopeptidase [Zunongwangia sp. F260]|uniref:Neutral metalloproteinase n=1 Tax=Autumnicola lenta TaxID=3075593 RepID=A0ABU3CPN3_9FLAO|nr:M4 family metallopeptidase [Zunongwangia sp. F260]MDT0648308.1 M4 family metallopeptidase [Zunongwangia sp. F260]